MMKNVWFVLCAILFLSACKLQEHPTEEPGKIEAANDPHSFAKPDLAVVTHLDLDIAVDFDQHQLQGTATWTIDNRSKGNEIIIDTRGLSIQQVYLEGDSIETKWRLDSADAILGQALHIDILPGTKKLSVRYHTTSDASGLQWLSPEQTAGKKHPFLFSQSESIHARSWVPCQDGPAVRFTYDAVVSVPKDLLAVMSAENPQEKNSEAIYHFRQTHPIPSYLLALAVGNIAFKAVDKRTGVYAEPSMLDNAAWEFADMGKMVDAAEQLYGPYKWGRYDILVLPPSFPYGGMENPNLTFATPTVIAGDRSLVSLVAHELAHSWSGNLVTNATWNDMWLNEGFTTYFERRLVEALYGKDEFEMQELLGKNDLLNAAKLKGDTTQDAALRSDYTGRDPDDVGSDVIYEKGYSFLKMLELQFGRQKFDAFLKDYFETYAFQSMTTTRFLAVLKSKLFNNDEALIQKAHLDEWIYQPGIPANAPVYQAGAFGSLDSLTRSWQQSQYSQTALFNNKKLNTKEALYLLKHLPADISAAQMASLDSVYHFTQSGNAEIQTAWYTLAVEKQYSAAYGAMEHFLETVGRMKFLKPIYRALIKTEAGKIRAQKVFEKAKAGYHPIAVKTIEKILEGE